MAPANLFAVFGSLGTASSAMRTLIQKNVPEPSLHVLAHAGDVRLAPHADQSKFGRIEFLDVPVAPGGPAGVEVILKGAEISGIGPVLTLGELVLADSELLHFQAGIIGRMRRLGVSEAGAKEFLDAVRHGYTVLGVGCSSDKNREVAEILGDAGPVALRDALAAPLPHAAGHLWDPSRSPHNPPWDIALFLPGLPGDPLFPKPGKPPQPQPGKPPQPQTPPLPPNVLMY